MRRIELPEPEDLVVDLTTKKICVIMNATHELATAGDRTFTVDGLYWDRRMFAFVYTGRNPKPKAHKC